MCNPPQPAPGEGQGVNYSSHTGTADSGPWRGACVAASGSSAFIKRGPTSTGSYPEQNWSSQGSRVGEEEEGVWAVNGKKEVVCGWGVEGRFRGNGKKEGCLRESICFLPGHGVPSWGCWGCVGGAVHGGTAESRVVPLRKKSDIRKGRGKMWVYTWRNYPIKVMRGRWWGGLGRGGAVGSQWGVFNLR